HRELVERVRDDVCLELCRRQRNDRKPHETSCAVSHACTSNKEPHCAGEQRFARENAEGRRAIAFGPNPLTLSRGDIHPSKGVSSTRPHSGLSAGFFSKLFPRELARGTVIALHRRVEISPIRRGESPKVARIVETRLPGHGATPILARSTEREMPYGERPGRRPTVQVTLGREGNRRFEGGGFRSRSHGERVSIRRKQRGYPWCQDTFFPPSRVCSSRA